jgi:phosphatidylethanolamine/phosphatidyl-N-methylethanolamine N-methyltransferase
VIRRAEGFTLFGRFYYNERVERGGRNLASPHPSRLAAGNKYKRSGRRVTKSGIEAAKAEPALAAVPNGNSALTFFRQWLKAPRRMGSVAPSSHHLARAMARLIPAAALAERAPIIELGGGTGSITRGLIEAGVPPDRLFVVERDPTLAELLRGRFVGVHVLCGDAAALPALLQPHGIHRVGAIVSGLPLLLFPEDVLARLVESCFTLLGAGHPLIQFTYGFKSPLASQSHNLISRRAAWVPRNLPPAFVWTYRR